MSRRRHDGEYAIIKWRRDAKQDGESRCVEDWAEKGNIFWR